MQKGLTYIEILIVLGVILLISGIMTSTFKIQKNFLKARDLQRIQDLISLNNILNSYLRSSTLIDLDGPVLENRGIDESLPTIFVSIPLEEYKFNDTYVYNTSTYYFYQVNKNDYQRIDGFGWIPINFQNMSYLNIGYLPVDPINSFDSGLYYLYAFRKLPPQYEITAKFESPEYQNNGLSDKVSTDGGNDENRFEIGSNLNLIPPLIW